jgi:PhzF family phenazine biosynthesis protein
MNTRAFKQVDVFTSVHYQGNALAVVLDADGLSASDMQRVAAWTNLSETTFVLPPTQAQADYRVRIFTPRSELPFAGHPSVGTAHALLEAGRIAPHPGLVQECAAGLLPMRVLGDGPERRIFVRAPRANLHAPDAAVGNEVARALAARLPDQYPPRVVNVGPNWLICDVGEEAVVRSLNPDMPALAALCRHLAAVGVGVFGRAANATDYALAVRAFCPADGIPEDPVTGSANAAIGAYLHASGQLDTIGANYRVSQGREVDRDGFVDVRVDTTSGDVEIGGQSVTCIDGVLTWP